VVCPSTRPQAETAASPAVLGGSVMRTCGGAGGVCAAAPIPAPGAGARRGAGRGLLVSPPCLGRQRQLGLLSDPVLCSTKTGVGGRQSGVQGAGLRPQTPVFEKKWVSSSDGAPPPAGDIHAVPRGAAEDGAAIPASSCGAPHAAVALGAEGSTGGGAGGLPATHVGSVQRGIAMFKIGGISCQ
jgi:hypothetical protein